VKKGDCVVITHEGPKGGPGMQEMARLITLGQSTAYGEKIAPTTDGRFSGMTRGASIGHISPEAAAGGPLALVKDGDRIHYDVNEKVLEVLISDEELEARRKAWKAPAPKAKNGWLARYAKLVTSAAQGAVPQ
jgi:dihydroxy-acid dehydratase